MSARRQANGLRAMLGVGALAMLCCIAVPAVLGAVAGAAVGGLLGEGAAAFVALVGAFALYRRRARRSCRC